jgi:hypothetical protein
MTLLRAATKKTVKKKDLPPRKPIKGGGTMKEAKQL